MIHRLWACFLLLVCSQSQVFAQTFTISSQTFVVSETAGALNLQVTRTGLISEAGSVNVMVFPYGFNSATVEAGGEVQAPGIVEFAAGQAVATAVIPIANDSETEGDETFGIVLRRESAYGKIGLSSYALVTIRDDESPASTVVKSPPGPPSEDPVMLEGDIMCLFGTPYDDYMYWNRILTPVLSPTPFFFPTAIDMCSPKMIALGGRGEDTFTYSGGEYSPLPLCFDGEQGVSNKIVVRSNSARDTNTAYYCTDEVWFVSQREAGTVGNVSYPASSWTVDAENVQVIDICVQVGGGFGDGKDVAFFKDTAGDDCLVADANKAVLTGAGYENIAKGFDKTVVYGTTGFDKATFNGSVDDEEFTAKPKFARMTGVRANPFNNGLNNTDYDNYVQCFDKVIGNSAGGDDVAYLSGSNQPDDYVGTPEYGELNGVNAGLDYCLRANGFLDTVVFGGGPCDVATLYDSDNDDIFVGRRGNSAIFDIDRNYSHTVKGFSQVDGISDAGGNDEAQLYDTHGSDRITAEPRVATLLTVKKFTASATGFDRVLAISNQGGNDTIDQSRGLWYFFRRIGNWR